MPFEVYIEHLLRVSSTCLVRFEHNRYSVPAQYAGHVVSVRVTAERLVIAADNQIIAEHTRCFGREQLVCDPWHYLPILEKKPGALRHGAPFQTWELPQAISKVQQQLMQQKGGDRAFVELLLLLALSLSKRCPELVEGGRETSLETLEVACELALESGIVQGSVIQNEMRRLSEPNHAKAIDSAHDLTLKAEPQADCARYDAILGGTSHAQ